MLKLKFFQRVSAFLRQVWFELRKVVWPSRQEAVVFTGVVLASVAAVALLIWAADTVISNILILVLE